MRQALMIEDAENKARAMQKNLGHLPGMGGASKSSSKSTGSWKPKSGRGRGRRRR